MIWATIKGMPEHEPELANFLTSGHDADGDGIADLDDALPFDRDNNNLPDGLAPKTKK